ncbi:sarcosine oxidase subunit delta [Curvivirga sp.]|uniref:sarcosine oxidase subunit delta n=1 Tax=Curvivirga sp. TaxID=2856848 RepID=UPI003B5B23C7
MQKITCPYCGERSEEEFKYAGPSHLERSIPASEVTDSQWAEYLFMRDNVKGISLERWGHIHGCSQYFNVIRNTVTHEIYGCYKMGEQPPKGWQKLGEKK